MELKTCVICVNDSGAPLIKLREKGSDGINAASQDRGDVLLTSAGQFVHAECRRLYTNSNEIAKWHHQKRVLSESTTNIPTLRSKSQFSFNEHCFFCGQVAVKDRKKGIEIFPVRTADFHSKIIHACNERCDEWASEVRGRLECVNDLHAADAVYHQTCSVNFRTNKSIPQAFSPDSKIKRQNRGRPAEQFAEIVEYLKANEDEQITISDLVDLMKNTQGEQNAFSPVHMKKRLQNHFGNDIIIADMNGKSSVVTLRDTANSILHNFYNRPTCKDPESEKLEIIKTAANFLKSDIRSMTSSKDYYPSVSEISSSEQNFEYVPNTLRLLLKMMFSERDSELKVSSIGQAMIQSTRPRTVIAPLQIGLGVQLHHSFASRFLVETLHNLGFCSAYSEIQKFESSAALAQGIDVPGYVDNSFIQYVADNVDHNLRTIDGNDTFHGMGIIAAVTPGTTRTIPIPRLSVSSDELKSLAHIKIKYYKPPSTRMSKLVYQELSNLRTMDQTAHINLLSLLTWPLRAPTPAWSGMMQMIQHGDYPGKSTVVFLPMIDMSASDISCVYSTMHFVSGQARRYNTTPVLTFDQPLFWKAFTILSNELPDSPLKSIVLRLGGFHTEMSFLGCIGHIMSGTGLHEILELIYASNAVSHMLSGKAVARAIRGHMLVDVALHALHVTRIFNIEMDAKQQEQEIIDDITNQADELNQQENDISFDDVTHTDFDRAEGKVELLKQANQLFDMILEGKLSADAMSEHSLTAKVKDIFEKELKSYEHHRTAKLWLQYSKMIELLRKFIKAERAGNWCLHLQAVHDMLPYFAAAGHNLYAKSAYVYLTMMQQLPDKHPAIFAAFQAGHHTLRRSDRYWAGLSSDLIIEQVLMRSVKTSGGMTRGRGMGETQRAQWLMSMPSCADINQAMQGLTGADYHTSDQHKDVSPARQTRDMKDILTVLDFIKDRNPFNDDKSLRNIDTGILAGPSVNTDTAEEVGAKIIQSMVGQNLLGFSFKRVNQVITLGSKTQVKVEGEPIQIDPQLLFQRCTMAASGVFDDPSEIFKYELCSVPSSLFDKSGLPREAQKSVLADSIWNLGECGVPEIDTDAHYILDGGSLMHRIPWTRGDSFSSICKVYVDYVKRRYQNVTVVFDGYPDHPLTKDIAHMRRTEGINSPKVNFTADMPCKSKKEVFLSNQNNKQSFINLLSTKLQENDCTVVHAPDDADLFIVKTAVTCSLVNKTVVIGEDTDLLVLLCFHAKYENNEIFFKSEQKQSVMKCLRIWDIKKTKTVLGNDICNLLPVLHAFTGCDTVSRIFGIGKGTVLKKVKSSNYFKELAVSFMNKTDVTSVTKLGEEMFVCMYGGLQNEGLDLYRYRKFASKVVVGNIFVQVHTLPPTSDAAQFHSMRAYLQCQTWIGNGDTLNPHDWGWYTSNNKLLPIKGTLAPAPDKLLKVIRCNCTLNCDSRRCSCRKYGINCSISCGECRGINCSNSSNLESSDLDDIY